MSELQEGYDALLKAARHLIAHDDTSGYDELRTAVVALNLLTKVEPGPEMYLRKNAPNYKPGNWVVREHIRTADDHAPGVKATLLEMTQLGEQIDVWLVMREGGNQDEWPTNAFRLYSSEPAEADQSVPKEHVDQLRRQLIEYGNAKYELIEAIRLTQEYIQLPALPGWSWYDAMLKHAPDVLEAMSAVSKPVSIPVEEPKIDDTLHVSRYPEQAKPWVVERTRPNSGDVVAEFTSQNDAHAFAEVPDSLPDACQCNTQQDSHERTYARPLGWHKYVEPSRELRQARLRYRLTHKPVSARSIEEETVTVGYLDVEEEEGEPGWPYPICGSIFTDKRGVPHWCDGKTGHKDEHRITLTEAVSEPPKEAKTDFVSWLCRNDEHFACNGTANIHPDCTCVCHSEPLKEERQTVSCEHLNQHGECSGIVYRDDTQTISDPCACQCHSVATPVKTLREKRAQYFSMVKGAGPDEVLDRLDTLDVEHFDSKQSEIEAEIESWDPNFETVADLRRRLRSILFGEQS